MNRIMWLGALVTTISLTAMAQQDAPAPDSPPDTPPPAHIAEPADGADAPREVREVEITGPVGQDERRTIRVVGQDGSFWVNDSGDLHDLSVVMDKSLEYNPEIQAIRAEIAALMARLKQLEMKTATDVARKGVEIKRLKDKRDKDKELVEKKLLAPEELAELDAEIAARDVEIRYLLGQNSLRTIEDGKADRARAIRVRGDAPFLPTMMMGGEPRPDLSEIKDKKLRDTLESPLTIQFEDVQLHEVVKFITEIYEINFNIDVPARSIPITIDLHGVRLRSALAALTDSNRDLVFVFRDYGVFATTRDRAVSISGPSIPENVPYQEGGFLFRHREEQAERVLDYVPAPTKAPAPTASPKPAPPAPATKP